MRIKRVLTTIAGLGAFAYTICLGIWNYQAYRNSGRVDFGVYVADVDFSLSSISYSLVKKGKLDIEGKVNDKDICVVGESSFFSSEGWIDMDCDGTLESIVYKLDVLNREPLTEGFFVWADNRYKDTVEKHRFKERVEGYLREE